MANTSSVQHMDYREQMPAEEFDEVCQVLLKKIKEAEIAVMA